MNKFKFQCLLLNMELLPEATVEAYSAYGAAQQYAEDLILELCDDPDDGPSELLIQVTSPEKILDGKVQKFKVEVNWTPGTGSIEEVTA